VAALLPRWIRLIGHDMLTGLKRQYDTPRRGRPLSESERSRPALFSFTMSGYQGWQISGGLALGPCFGCRCRVAVS